MERVYQNSLAWELEERGLIVVQQAPIEVMYRDRVAGEYFADLLVQSCVIVELKAVEEINPKHEAQLLNYLKATEIEVGLLLNFGPKPQVKRKIFDASYKRKPTNP